MSIFQDRGRQDRGLTGSARPRGAAQKASEARAPRSRLAMAPPISLGPGDPGLTLKRTGMSPGAGASATATVNETKSPEGAGQQQSVP